MCVCIYTHIAVYIYIYIYACMYVFISIYVSLYVYLYVYIHIHLYSSRAILRHKDWVFLYCLVSFTYIPYNTTLYYDITTCITITATTTTINITITMNSRANIMQSKNRGDCLIRSLRLFWKLRSSDYVSDAFTGRLWYLSLSLFRIVILILLLRHTDWVFQVPSSGERGLGRRIDLWYIYIYIYREREWDRQIYIYIYI